MPLTCWYTLFQPPTPTTMRKETVGEVIGNPLWFTPVMLLAVVLMIEGLHTGAHLHQELDVHGICRQNKEYIESKEDSY